MSHGPISVFQQTMASGATLTSGQIDLGRAWRSIYLEIPSMTSGAGHYIQASSDGSTFRRIYKYAGNDPCAETYVFQVQSGVTNAFVPVPGGYRYYKIETSETVGDGATYKFVCSD